MNRFIEAAMKALGDDALPTQIQTINYALVLAITALIDRPVSMVAGRLPERFGIQPGGYDWALIDTGMRPGDDE